MRTFDVDGSKFYAGHESNAAELSGRIRSQRHFRMKIVSVLRGQRLWMKMEQFMKFMRKKGIVAGRNAITKMQCFWQNIRAGNKVVRF